MAPVWTVMYVLWTDELFDLIDTARSWELLVICDKCFGDTGQNCSISSTIHLEVCAISDTFLCEKGGDCTLS